MYQKNKAKKGASSPSAALVPTGLGVALTGSF